MVSDTKLSMCANLYHSFGSAFYIDSLPQKCDGPAVSLKVVFKYTEMTKSTRPKRLFRLCQNKVKSQSYFALYIAPENVKIDFDIQNSISGLCANAII